MLKGEVSHGKTNPYLSGVAHGNCEGRDVAPNRSNHHIIIKVTKGLKH